jgi:hypothetical protein
VHVRRGDYVAKADIHGVMGMAYYEAALAAADAAGALPDDTRLLVITDDVAWAREQAGFASRGARIVDGEDELSSFHLLAACERARVCPNSSFCWWAAFLGRAMGQTAPIYMPRRWIKAHEKTSAAIYFEGVHKIDVDGDGR